MDRGVRSIGILGGGSAGLLAALALRRAFPELPVTVLASSEIGVIGVGEATTPLLPQFLHVDLGLDVHRLFREVRPTLKLGIRFDWGPERPGTFYYPFGPLSAAEPWRYDGDVLACSPRSILMAADRVPVFETESGWESTLDPLVGYHLDNRRFVAYLEREARSAGVRFLDRRVTDVELARSCRGHAEATRVEVAALVDDRDERHAFDLYLDASGFRSRLIGEALGSPFQSYRRLLPTDRAVIGSASNRRPLPPYTRAETWSAGWCWSTPQRDLDHRGYVYSSAHSSPEEASAEMRARVPGLGETRTLRFRAGRRRHFWRGNVVALGNAYGFVEPLESTALHMLIRQIGWLVRALARGVDSAAIADLDRRAGESWDYLAWFLALHYRFNRRLSTPFWRDARASVDVSDHGELIEHFRERGPLSATDPSLVPSSDPLWGAEGVDLLLLGQGVEPGSCEPRWPEAVWRRRVAVASETARLAATQDRALEALDERPELLEAYAASLRDVGPAFLAPAGRPREEFATATDVPWRIEAPEARPV